MRTRANHVAESERVPRTLLLFLGALLAMVPAACAWSVPADPGLNARLRNKDAWAATSAVPTPQAPGGPTKRDPIANDPATRALYLRKCSQCHEPFAPTDLPASAWPAMVQKYAPRAGLFGAERDRVLRWLMANAR